MTCRIFKLCGIWHYRFQVAGVRIQKTTRQSSRSRAQAIADKAYENAKLMACGTFMVPHLPELITAWLSVHSLIASPAHIRSVETFSRLHMYNLADVPINKITTEMVETARNEHLKNHAPASVNHWMTILKLLCNWAVKREIIGKLSWKVRMLKVQKRPRSILPVTSAMAWLSAIDEATSRNPSVATAVRLMFGLGLRESEASSARWEWIDWNRKTYTPGITKGREADPIPTPAWLLDHLRQRAQESGLISPARSGAMLKPGFARTSMRSANRQCGIQGLTPHRLRGTFATLLSENGVPVQTIQKVMRHKSPLTTMAYLENNLDIAISGQARIASQTGMAWRESGEQPAATPHQMGVS